MEIVASWIVSFAVCLKGINLVLRGTWPLKDDDRPTGKRMCLVGIGIAAITAGSYVWDGARHLQQSRARISALEAQLAKQPATQNTTEQK